MTKLPDHSYQHQHTDREEESLSLFLPTHFTGVFEKESRKLSRSKVCESGESDPAKKNDRSRMTSKEERVSVQEMYRSIQRTIPDISEEDLKTGSTNRYQQSVFVTEAMKQQYDSLPEDTKKSMAWYGENYYGRIIDQIPASLERDAKGILLTVSSGLDPKELTEDERMIVRKIYGEEWYKLAQIETDPYATTATVTTADA